jgi:hypothetical protein
MTVDLGWTPWADGTPPYRGAAYKQPLRCQGRAVEARSAPLPGRTGPFPHPHFFWYPYAKMREE